MQNLELNNFFTKVFGKLALGIFITAAISFLILEVDGLTYLFSLPFAEYFIMIALIVEIGFVWYLSARINKLSIAAANLIFYIYCILNGITLTVFLTVYDPGMVFIVFGITAFLFLVMYFFGRTTKMNITNYGPLFFFCLIGLLLSILINIFLQSPALDFAITIIGIGVFIGLIVYDTKTFSLQFTNLQSLPASDREIAEKRLVVISALSFYLDFINLFIYLLRLLGKRK